MNEYIWIGIILFLGWVLIRYFFEKIMNENKELNVEDIEVKVCPVCGSMETTMAIENTAIGFTDKCKECKYTGAMLEMNLVQAKEYYERKNN